MNENTMFTYKNVIGKIVFKYDSPYWLTDIDGLSGIDVDVAESRSIGQIGASLAGQSVRPRSFTLDGAIFEPIAEHRKQLLHIIAPQTPATLTMEYNGETWWLDVIPEQTPEITPGNGVQFFQTKLKALYPYWRTAEEHSTQLAGLEALFRFPFCTGGTWYISRHTSSYFTTVENSGNVPIEFKITFTATTAIENPEIRHVGTGAKIMLRKAMVAGEKIIVSTVYGDKGVLCISPKGEKTNGFRYLTLDSNLSMALLPGKNILRTDAVNRSGLNVLLEAPKGVKSGI